MKHLYRPKPETGWSWSGVEKRWHFRGLRDRIMIRSPSYEKDAAGLAYNYFGTREPDGGAADLRSLLAWVAARSKQLVVVLPPSEARFQQISESYHKQRRYWALVKREAQHAGAILIDCSSACVEQSGFADAVHLNDAGAMEYSTRLSRLLPRGDDADR